MSDRPIPDDKSPGKKGTKKDKALAEDLEDTDATLIPSNTLEPVELTEESYAGLLVADQIALSGISLEGGDDFTTEDSGVLDGSANQEASPGILDTVYDVRVHLTEDFSALLEKSEHEESPAKPDFFEPIVIGRDLDCSVVLTGPLVSSKHARLLRTREGLELEDLDSANGTFVAEQPIKRVRIGWEQPFRIGNKTMLPRDLVRKVVDEHADDQTSIQPFELEDDETSGWTRRETPKMATIDFGEGDAIVVGRGAEADIVLDTPNVSRSHARLERSGDALSVTDLGSTNGTYVNGRRIVGSTTVYPDDDLRIGPHRLELTSDLKVAKDQSFGSGIAGVRVEAWKLCRQVGSAKSQTMIVDEVDFAILPGEMVAIMGPSGAGKTSVLTTLAGYTRPSSGDVHLDGLNLFHHYDVFRSAIGYVPQEDVMHSNLTVEEVLYYQARLMFPAEYTDKEIYERITLVLKRLDLNQKRYSLVGDEVRRGLSGGQRKRLNVAMELLSEPSLLLLDEPTSGLDSRSAYNLIRQCRTLAEAGRTVVMTVHQPRLESFALFDKLMLLTKGGKLAYFGPADKAREYFSQRSEVPKEAAANPADYVLEALDPAEPRLAKQPDYWQRTFRVSREYERFVGRRMKSGALGPMGDDTVSAKRKKSALFRQARILTSRAYRLILRDRSAITVQILQAPIIAGLAVLLFQKGRFWPMRLEDDVTPTLFIIVAAAVWFGTSNVAREIVGERSIYRRERMRKLRPGAYLLAKLVVNGSVVAIQMLVLTGLLIPVIGLEGALLPLIGIPLIAGWSAMCLGLLVSTIAKSEVTAIQIVPLVVLPQVMLSGILVAVGGPASSTMATFLSQPVLLRWAYGAYLHVEFAEGTARGDKSHSLVTGGRYWEQVGFGEDVLLFDVAMMCGIGTVCVLATWWILVRRNRR